MPIVLRALVAVALLALARPAFPQSLDTSPGTTGAMILEILRLDPGGGNFLVQRGYDVHAKNRTSDVEAAQVEAMFGRLATGSFSDTDATIRTFMGKYGKLLGLPDGQDPLAGMRKFREFSHDTGKWIQYCPQKDGLDYVSGLMTYVFRSDGTMCALVGRYKPVTGSVGGGLARAAAIEKARERIAKDLPDQEVNITGPVKIAECLVDDLEGNRGVIRLVGVTLDVGQPPRAKRVLMLGDGTVLWMEDGGYGACTGKIFPHDPVTDNEQLTKEDLPDILHPGSFWRSYVINGKDVKVDSPMAFNRASAFFGGFSENPFDPDPSEKFAEINAYYFITKALARAREGGLTEKEMEPFLPLYFDHWAWPECYHLEPTEEDTDPAVRAAKQKEFDECRAHRTGNAWFDPTTTRLYFAADNPGFVRKTVGDRVIEKHSAYEGTVMAHEFGHWVHYILNPHHNLTGTYGANLEARAVQEGVADVFSAITCQNQVIAKYFLDADKRDLTADVKYSDVIPLWDIPVPAGQKGRTYHNASLAFSSAYWHIKSDMGEGPALKVLLAGMRMCHTPCRFQNMALATLAMDQLLNSSPQGKRMADRFKTNEMIQTYYFLTHR